jgi:hypothetical protein
MKLVIVTAVEEFEKSVFQLFKKSGIHSFSHSDIDGYKNGDGTVLAANWFGSQKGSAESLLFFSFTEEGNIDLLFKLIAEFNTQLETNNPVKAVVVPIEKYI